MKVKPQIEGNVLKSNNIFREVVNKSETTIRRKNTTEYQNTDLLKQMVIITVKAKGISRTLKQLT